MLGDDCPVRPAAKARRPAIAVSAEVATFRLDCMIPITPEPRSRFPAPPAVAAVGLGVLWLVWLLAPILTPFVFAALLGWLGDPLVDRLQRRAARATPR
jgi:hypothetical protein